MAELYRKSALEKISSPEQLDKALRVTSPMTWLVLTVATALAVIAIVWSIVGSIPITVTANGIVSSPTSTNALFMSESGTVVSVSVYEGREIHIQDEILKYRVGDGEVKTLYSDQTGVLSHLGVKTGDTVSQGNEIARVSPLISSSDHVVVCYASLADAKKIQRGMEVRVFLTSAESQTYGHMVGRVTNVDSYVSSNAGMAYVLGEDNNLAASFQNDGAPVVAVTCELYPDTTGRSVSGYYWSNARGEKLPVSNGSLVSAKFVTKVIPPITKLFSQLQDVLGG